MNDFRIFFIFMLTLLISSVALLTFYEGDNLPVLAVPSLFAAGYVLLAIFYHFTEGNDSLAVFALTAGLLIHAGTAVIESFKLTEPVIAGLVVWILITFWAAARLFSRPVPGWVKALAGWSILLFVAEILLIVIFYISVLVAF